MAQAKTPNTATATTATTAAKEGPDWPRDVVAVDDDHAHGDGRPSPPDRTWKTQRYQEGTRQAELHALSSA